MLHILHTLHDDGRFSVHSYLPRPLRAHRGLEYVSCARLFASVGTVVHPLEQPAWKAEARGDPSCFFKRMNATVSWLAAARAAKPPPVYGVWLGWRGGTCASHQ